jgi:hypothetical protein
VLAFSRRAIEPAVDRLPSPQSEGRRCRSRPRRTQTPRAAPNRHDSEGRPLTATPQNLVDPGLGPGIGCGRRRRPHLRLVLEPRHRRDRSRGTGRRTSISTGRARSATSGPGTWPRSFSKGPAEQTPSGGAHDRRRPKREKIAYPAKTRTLFGLTPQARFRTLPATDSGSPGSGKERLRPLRIAT